MGSTDYKLSRELVGHTSDVRSLAIGVDGNIVSVSNDKTAIFWKFQHGQFTEDCIVMKGHSVFVSSVCIINPSEAHPNGLIVTGSSGDKHICIYKPGEVQPFLKLEARGTTVCTLKTSIFAENCFFSSSWDKTAKLWNLNNLSHLEERTYTDNSTFIWCVADLHNGSVVTGGEVATVYSRAGESLHVLRGHSGCIRDIAVINENEFMTCASENNELPHSTIKHWSALTGECLGNYNGHTDYVYSISAMLQGHLMASSGEDNTVRIWKEKEIIQTIDIPAQSIWCVRLFANEDIVCGASDGIVRIFTANPERYADAETLQKFDESVANFKKSTKKTVDLKQAEEKLALKQPGKTDGETKLVRVGLGLKTYTWSQSEFNWIISEDFDGNPTDPSKTLYKGIEYDYVFSSYSDGGPLRIPYNYGQDPWLAARKCTEDNQLPSIMAEELGYFILSNLKRGPLKKESCEYIPMKDYFRLEQESLDSVIDELKEYNAKPEVQSLSEDNLELVCKLMTDNQEEAIASGAIGHVMTLLNWPDEFVFPVLNVACLAVLQKNVNEKLCTDELLSLIGRLLEKESKNQMMTFRLLTNMFCHEMGEKLAFRCKDDVLNAITGLNSVDQDYQLAVSTYVLNLAVAVNKTFDSATAKRLFDAAINLHKIFNEPEAVFRILVAIGNLFIAYPEFVRYARVLSFQDDIYAHVSNLNDPFPGKVNLVSRFLTDILQ